MSIEQFQPFHQVRRILKAVAPDYRLLATSLLPPDHTILDAKNKVIEIGESTEIYAAVASLLFNIGHVLLQKDPDFAPLFGVGINRYKGEEIDLIRSLALLGKKADLSAATWANDVLQAYWPVKAERAKELIGNQIWSEDEWIEYFSV